MKILKIILKKTAILTPPVLKSGHIIYALVFILTVASSSLKAQVTFKQDDDGGYTLYRNGKPYDVKGVGGETQLDYAVKIGANSIRTWGIDNAEKVLDEAQKKGLTVMLGFWLQHERHGFDYDDEEKVARQLAHFKNIVNKYKDHPALLMWGIGNELNLQYTNPKAWDAVQEIAKYIHQVDPNHPTSTVTAGLDSTVTSEIIRRVPDMDIYCINTYGDISHAVNKVDDYGWKGPYMITEWGPNGYWEAPKTKWNISIEQTSTEKKNIYYERFTKYIQPEKKCIGSYAFLWGAKQEYTETWFGLFSKDNQPTEPIDALEVVFTQNSPALPTPTILDLTIDGKHSSDNIYLIESSKHNAKVEVEIATGITEHHADTDQQIKYYWKILRESTDKKSGGDQEEEAQEISGLIKGKRNPEIKFRVPNNEGAYRLFVYAYLGDKQAYANIPFYVNKSPEGKQSRFIQFKKTDMSSFEHPYND